MVDEGAPIREAPPDFIQSHWTSPPSDATFEQLITEIDAENVKRLNAYQDPFGSGWLNVVRSKSLGLKLTDQQLVMPPPGCENLRETLLPLW